MPKCQFLFSAVFGFRNPSKEIFSESDEINAHHPIFPRSFQNTREPPKESHRGPTHGGGAARAWAAPPCCLVASSALRLRLFAYLRVPDLNLDTNKPRYEKPSRA